MRIRWSFSVLALAAVASATPALADHLGDLDRDFLVKTQQTNLAELAGADYALAHSNSPRLANYANAIQQSHTIAVRDVEMYARGAGVELPTEPSADQAAQQQQLEKLSGRAFETAYLKDQIAGHEAEIALARQEARYGSQANVAALARQLIAPLEYHLSLAQSTLASIDNPVQSGELSPPRGS